MSTATVSCQLASSTSVPVPALLTLYSDWHFCSACGLPPFDFQSNDATPTKKRRKLFACTRCKTVAYHNAECQKDHWKQRHKRDCKLLAQAIKPLLDICHCWNEFQSMNHKSGISWWDLDRLDPNGGKHCHRLWETSEIQWNRYGQYLEAMAGFQRALEPVTKLWRKQTTKPSQSRSSEKHISPRVDDSGSLGMSNLSLHEKQNRTNTNDTTPSTETVTSIEEKLKTGISLARRLLFCSYCEADGNQVQASRMRLAQCITILLECAYYNQKNISADRRKQVKINSLLNDAWMELMLSYEEEQQISHELRTISRHVVHMAIQSSRGNTLYDCEWRNPLQRPGYMATLEEITNGNATTASNDSNDNRETVLAPPYIPPEDHPLWCKTLESHWKEIAAELSSLVKEKNSNCTDWTVVGSGDRGSGGDDHRVVSPGGKWTEFVLFGTGSSRNTADAPFTKKILQRCVPDAISLAEAGGGEVIFSKLEPKTRIAAHCGPTNFRWTAHLGLTIPSSTVSSTCSIRVADEWHQWQTGKVFLFDDSYEHEIRNDTDEVRIVLLLRLWHPRLPSHRRQIELNRALHRKEESVEKRYKAPSV